MKHAIRHIHFVGIGGAGMNGIAEAVRQIRGTSVNQHSKADRVLITAGAGVPTGAAILEKGV